MAPHAGYGVTLGIESQEEQRDAVAFLQVSPAKGVLKPVVAVPPLSLAEIVLPQVRTLGGVVTLEADA
jgi:hypothetical protein